VIVWPGISLHALVLLFGAFALARGIVELGVAIRSPVKQGRGWLFLSSLAGIVVGIVVFAWTDMSALALLYVIGAYAIAFGIITVGGAFWLPLVDRTDRLLLTLAGFVSIAFGIVMFAKPGDGALVLLALIAAYALIVGLAEVTFAVAGKQLLTRSVERRMTPAGAQSSR
jgi:uncharacterized membrane protein HdeD (DUF308 family)